MRKKKTEVTIRSSAAEYLTFVASTGDRAESYEMRYEDENIWLTQNRFQIQREVAVSDILPGQGPELFYADRFDFVVYERQGKTKLGSERLFEVTDQIIRENIRKGNLKE